MNNVYDKQVLSAHYDILPTMDHFKTFTHYKAKNEIRAGTILTVVLIRNIIYTFLHVYKSHAH